MRTAQLGQTPLDVPVIGLGTWSVFDTTANRAPLVEAALGAGVRLFDSSPMYGKAEECLATSLGDRRREALIATKVSATEADVGVAQIRHALDLFGIVDLYQLHNIAGWKSHLPVLERLKAEGRCRAIGASQGLLVSDDAFIEVMRTGLIDSVQVRFNPRRQDAARRILGLAADLGIGVMVMQPLRWGVLLADPTPAELAALGVADWGQAILKWILTDQRITSVLTASSDPARIASNAVVADHPVFTPEQRHLVERILDRGGSSRAAADTMPATPPPALGAFLAERRGASYCAPCLSREFRCSEAAASAARDALGREFAIETAACLVCGATTSVVRSRTILR